MDSKDRLFIRLNEPRSDVPKDYPNVILSLTAFKKMRLWTQLGSDLGKVEVSGLGTVLARHGGLYVNDIFLIRPEKIGGGHVDMDGQAVQELMMEVMTRGPKFATFRGALKQYYDTGNFPENVPGAFETFADFLTKSSKLRNLRFHWHSHNNFGVGWSGTDEKTARQEFCPDAKWTVSVVTNTMGHFLARQDFPKTQGHPRHHLPVWLFLGIPGHVSKKYRQIYEEKVATFLRGEYQEEPEDVPFDELADRMEEIAEPRSHWPTVA